MQSKFDLIKKMVADIDVQFQLRWGNFVNLNDYEECTNLDQIQSIVQQRNALLGYSLDTLIR